MLAREVNDRFIVNEHGDLSLFRIFKSSDHLLSIQGVKTIAIPSAEQFRITGNVEKYVFLVDFVRN